MEEQPEGNALTMSVLPDSEELHFGFAARCPSIDGLRIFDSVETTLLGEPFSVNVIGSSHFVYSEPLGFYEVCSCETIDDGNVHTLKLSTDMAGEFAFEADGVACTVEVWADDLAAYPADRTFDLAYEFSPDAYTAIAVDDDDPGYETYHTYPEHDLTVHTRTHLERT